MTSDMPETLGQVLSRRARPAQQTYAPNWAGTITYALTNSLIWTAIVLLFLSGGIMSVAGAVALLVLAVGWGVLSVWYTPLRRGYTAPVAPHFLLAGDRQGFMGGLRLDAKSAVFDGSNIFHFGVENGLGTAPIGLIAQQLRAEGYRIVCFFDANIFYRLIEAGAMADWQRHNLSLLLQILGLHKDEVYIVPSNVQADKYVLSTLKHLPISFAVTNDQFRDYGKIYGDVMKGDQWRKGVRVAGNELKLHKFRFQTPLRLPPN